jgi:hypothetical protein
MDDWPFDDPPNVMVFTVRQIINDGHPILLVSRDEDGMWQFLTGETLAMSDAMLVCLKEVLRRDGSLAELADLPVGWGAWRGRPDSPWNRRPHDDVDV